MSTKQNNYLQQGFTLVELAIVLIVIGIIIGGITVGTGLIRQSKLNSIITDARNYEAAYVNFMNRYLKAPGDLDYANTLWTSNCTVASVSCSGNGNGLIDASASGIDESWLAWKHLDLSGFLNQGMVLVPSTTSSTVPVISQNVPAGKIDGTGYMMSVGSDTVIGSGGATHPSGLWNDSRTNAVFIAKTAANNKLTGGSITSEDAFTLDKKFDDASVDTSGNYNGAKTGGIRTFEDIAASPAKSCLTATTTYAVPATTISCVLGVALN